MGRFYLLIDVWIFFIKNSGDKVVQYSSGHSVVSDSLRPHESQHARLPCPSPTPRVYPNSCPLSQWCHTAISSSVIPFSSCPQSLPISGYRLFFLLIPFLASFSQSTTPSLQSPPLTALTFTVSFLYYFFLSTDGIIYISLVLCLPSAFFNLNIRSLREEF